MFLAASGFPEFIAGAAKGRTPVAHPILHLALWRELRNRLEPTAPKLLLAKVQIAEIVFFDYFDSFATRDQQPRLERRRRTSVITNDTSDRLNDFTCAAACHDITSRACLYCHSDIPLILGRRQNDRSHVWTNTGYAGGCLGAFTSHIKIEQHDIRSEFPCDFEGVGHGRPLPHNLNTNCALEYSRHPLARYRIVSNDGDAD